MALKVKTFGMEIKPLKTMQELGSLDTMVNRFVAENGIKRLIGGQIAGNPGDGRAIGQAGDGSQNPLPPGLGDGSQLPPGGGAPPDRNRPFPGGVGAFPGGPLAGGGGAGLQAPQSGAGGGPAQVGNRSSEIGQAGLLRLFSQPLATEVQRDR